MTGFRPSPFRIISKLILFGATFCLVPWLCLAAEDDPAEGEESDTKSKVTFGAEVEKKFAEFIDKVAEAKKKIWAEQARKEIEEMQKLTGLDAEKFKRMETAAERTTELCIVPWKREMESTWRNNYSQQTEESMPQLLEQVAGMTDDYARFNWFDHVHPLDHPSWSAAIKETMTAEQFAIWDKQSGERKEALRKQIADFLKPNAGRTLEQFRRSYNDLGAGVVRLLGLGKDVSKQIEELADSVAKLAVESWRKRAERIVWNAEETQRRQMMKEGNVYLPTDRRDTARLQTAWKKGLDAILSEDAKQRLQTIRADRKKRQVQAWTQLLIAELDKRVAFTSTQRERLGPVVERLLADKFTPDENEEVMSENGVPLNLLWTAGAGAKEEEMRAIIDDLQWKRWKQACRNRGGEDRPRIIARNFNAQPEDKQAEQSAEPEEIEGLLSDYLFDRACSERTRTLNAMMLKVEDATRVSSLSPTATERLQSAARGATEQSLTEWKGTLYEAVRPYANGGTVQTVTQRLANIQDYRLQRPATTSTEQQPLWDETVKKELSTEQRNAWQAVIRQREAYQQSAIAAALLQAFEEKVQLTDTQTGKLRPLLEKVMTEYGDDIQGMFSSSTNWYLQRYYMFLPIAGIPEKEMKELLTKEQWESWTGCNEFSNANNYWENIKRMHDQRNKNRK